jgi:hypothetical protein
MHADAHGTEDRNAASGAHTAPEPGVSAPVTERITVSGLDEQSAEALQMAITRLARRYGVEVRTEVKEEPLRSPE